MTIPQGRQLWFYTGGQYGYYLENDGSSLNICNHEGAKRLSVGWNTVKVGNGIPIATATPPQEYNLTLTSGWTGTAKYFKTQESVCVISLNISKSSELTTGESVGVVPAGFRPAYVKMSPASTFAPSGSTTVGISTDGSILLGDVSGQAQVRNVYATIVYIAGN